MRDVRDVRSAQFTLHLTHQPVRPSLPFPHLIGSRCLCDRAGRIPPIACCIIAILPTISSAHFSSLCRSVIASIDTSLSPDENVLPDQLQNLTDDGRLQHAPQRWRGDAKVSVAMMQLMCAVERALTTRSGCGRTVLAILLAMLPRFVSVAAQSVQVVTPVASQLPHPARIGQEFTFTLSPDTFVYADNTSTSPLNLGASPLPPWLSFDSPSRTFHGTPDSADAGSASIAVTACDGHGVVLASDTFDLAITNRQGNLTIALPLADQFVSNDSAITSAYPYPPDSPYFPGVRVPPNWSFSLGFQSWMYTTPSGSKVFYSASMSDGSPLPTWLYFNNNSVTFDGVAPGFNTSETFQVVLAGSDVPGYKDVAQGFNITISAFNLTALAEEERRAINITADGGTVDTVLDLVTLGNLRIDGSPIKANEIASFQLDLGTSKIDTLAFVTSNSSFVGSIDKSMVDKEVSVPLNLMDKWGDVLNTTLDIAFVPSSFKQSQLPPSILTPGQDYKVDLQPFLTKNKDSLNITTTVEPSKASSFVSINNAHELTGKVPSDVDYDSVIVHLLGVSGTTNATSRAEILLSLTGNGTEPATLAAHMGLPHGAIIAIGVISSIAGAILLLGLLLLLIRKLRKRRTESERGIGYQVGGTRDDEADVEGWRPTEYSKGLADHDGISDKDSRSPSLYVENGSGIGLNDPPRPTASPYPAFVPPPPSPGLFARLNPFSKQRSLGRRRFSGVKISKPIVTPDFGNAAYQAQLAHSVQLSSFVHRKSIERSTDVTPTIMVSHDGDELDELDNLSKGSRSNSPADNRSEHRSTHSADSTVCSDSRACDSPVSLSCYDEHADNSMVHPEGAQHSHAGEVMELDQRRESEYQDDQDSVDRTLDNSAIVYDSDDQSAAPWSKHSGGIAPRASSRPSLPYSESPSDLSLSSRSHPRVDHTVVTPPDDSSGQDIEISIQNIHFPTDSDIAGTESSSDAAILEEAIIGRASMVPARSASNRSTLESPITILNSPADSDATHSTLSVIPARPIPVPSRLVEFNKHKTVQVTAANDENQVTRNVSHMAVIHNSKSANSSVADPVTAHGRTSGSIKTELSTQTTEFTPPTPEKVKARPRRKTLLVDRTSTPPVPGTTVRQPLGDTDLNTPSPSPPSGLPKSLPSLPNIDSLLRKPASHRILLGVDEPFHFYPPLNYIVNGRYSVTGKPEIRSDASYIAQVESAYRKDVSMYPLPSWLKFEDMELWGVPVHSAKGDWTIRIMEYLHGQERVVGRFTLEVSLSSASMRDTAL